MSNEIVLTIVELGISIVIEGVILAMLFQFISNKNQEKNKQMLEQEMLKIESQNKFDFELLKDEIRQARTDVISQIKEGRRQ